MLLQDNHRTGQFLTSEQPLLQATYMISVSITRLLHVHHSSYNYLQVTSDPYVLQVLQK